MASEPSSNEVLRSQAHVVNATLSFVGSMSLKCAVDLGIPGAIQRHGGPMRLPELADVLSVPPAKAPCVGRLMRVLEHAGFFAREADGEGVEGYVLTPGSRLLGGRESLYARMVLDPVMIMPWLHLSSWFRGDEPTSFQIAHGMSPWEYAESNPEFNDLFNKGMTHDSDLVTGQIVAQCGAVFDEVRTLIDVGGGNGAVARAIAEAFPHLKCTVLDLPHVVAGLTASGRVDYVGGNMFDHIPPADAILIKRVLHDFNDEDCLKILRRCKEAIPSKEEGGKVILVEMVVNVVKDGFSKSLETQLFYDIEMMTITGGKERDEQEWQKIFIQAGFSSYQITLVTDLFSLIEIYP